MMANEVNCRLPQGLKPASLLVLAGTTEEAAEKVISDGEILPAAESRY